ncbi:hypothetical protein [Limimaricola hongkongensis]|uniref:Uncharacterized protein n=1 Tax=Limimaricola hongkongensis DSM 17492 TaxID=1122180 RepID=A0A017HCB5_9RHOB|nr:hypothetical protein [Limimaricola hongkongensis]EYD71950.1 hypothetical protein Lokhon_02022 [Limimaricola hongkongensis DSM 17492]
MNWPNKDPDDILDYGRDFSDEFPAATITAARRASKSARMVVSLARP